MVIHNSHVARVLADERVRDLTAGAASRSSAHPHARRVGGARRAPGAASARGLALRVSLPALWRALRRPASGGC